MFRACPPSNHTSDNISPNDHSRSFTQALRLLRVLQLPKMFLIGLLGIGALFNLSLAYANEIYTEPQFFDGEFFDQLSTAPALPVDDETGSYYFSVELEVDDVDDFRPIAVQGGKDSHNIEIYLKPVAGESPYLYINHNRGNGPAGIFDSVAYPFVRQNGRSLIGRSVHLEVIYSSSLESGVVDLVVKFDNKVQEPFPVIPRNGFNDVFSFRYPVSNAGSWVIGKIDHDQFGATRHFKGTMQNLRIGTSEESLAQVEASSERTLVINSPLQSVLDNISDPEETVPVSVLLKKPLDLPLGVDGWADIERVQQEFITKLDDLPGFDSTLQPVFSLTTSPILFVTLTPQQIGIVSTMLEVVSITDLPVVTEDTLEAYDIIYTPDNVVPPINGIGIGDSGYTGDGVLIAVVDSYLNPNPAYDNNIVATFNVAAEINSPASDTSNVASCVPIPSTVAPAHGSGVVSFAVGNGGVAPDAEIVYYNRSYCVGANEAGGGFEAILASFDKILVELELAGQGSGGFYAPDIVVTAQSVPSEGEIDFHDYTESCDAYLDETYPGRVDALRSIVLDHGVPIFASTGNKSIKSGTNFPSCLSFVTGVGSSSDTDEFGYNIDGIAYFSNSAEHLKLAAPGVLLLQRDIWYYFNEAGQKLLHPFIGTSYSAPIAAGVAALVLQKARECHTNGCGTLPIDSIEDSDAGSKLPGVLSGTGKLIPDPLAVDPDTQEALLIPRVNAFNALNIGLEVPVSTLQQVDTEWFMYGYESPLTRETEIDLVFEPGVDESAFEVEWQIDDSIANGTTYTHVSGGSEETELSYQIKIANRYGISRTEDKLLELENQPGIQFSTQLVEGNGNNDEVHVLFYEAPSPFNCVFDILVNGTYFSTFTSASLTSFPPTESDRCIGLAFQDSRIFKVKDLDNYAGENTDSYTIQLCRSPYDGVESDCSAVAVLPD